MCIFLFNRTTLQVFVSYLTGALYVVLLNKKHICSYLKCVVCDKLLKPRQSFRITLYFRKAISSFHCLMNCQLF